VLALQRAAGNQAVSSLLSRARLAPPHVVQRDGDPNATATAEPANPEDTAIKFEANAMSYFEDNMRAELMAAAGSEGIAIGRRASVAAGNAIRSTCEPYEKDQELDTNVLNTVFAVTSGGASGGEALTSGPRPGQGMDAAAAANVGSRAFRAAQGVVSVWIPKLAGYKTVGSLKEAAMRESTEAANQAGEGGSGSFADYQSAALDALHDDWANDIQSMKQQIIAGAIPPGMVSLSEQLLSTKRVEYMTKLRTQYGAASDIGSSTEAGIVSGLSPKLDKLRQHLDEAKAHREHVQEGASIVGGMVGGAAIGAGIGAFFGGVGAGPGALIGGAIGLVGGLIGAGVIASH
jgi:hypothetical protein